VAECKTCVLYAQLYEYIKILICLAPITQVLHKIIARSEARLILLSTFAGVPSSQ
jgi:hypothetical protein